MPTPIKSPTINGKIQIQGLHVIGLPVIIDLDIVYRIIKSGI